MLDQSATPDDRHKSGFLLHTQVPPLVRTLLKPLIALSLVFVFAAFTIVYLFFEPHDVQVARYFQLVLFLAGMMIILVLVRRVYSEVLKPMD